MFLSTIGASQNTDKWTKYNGLYIDTKSSSTSVIYAGFFGWGGRPKGWGPTFQGRNEILLPGKTIKFGVIFQKYALKLIKIWKIIEKMQNFPIFFLIFWRD